MRNSKRIAALFCVSALILSASACSGGGNGSSQNSSTGSKAESSVQSVQSGNDESSTESSSENSAESSAEESSGIPDENKLDWKFRDVAKPEIKDAVYTDRPGATEYDKEIHTTTPESAFDFEKAKESIKNNPKFANLRFVELEKEEQCYNISETGTPYVNPERDSYYIGFDAELDAIKGQFFNRSFSDFGKNVKVVLHIKRTYDKYDLPEKYELSINDTGMTQDDVYDIAKTIFNENVAEYLVYQQYEYKYNDEHKNYMGEEFMTPDDKCFYQYTRDVIKNSGLTKARLGIEFFDSRSGDYYCSTYQPMDWVVPISKMLEADIGGTDYLKPENFLDKALSVENKYEPYLYSTVQEEHYYQASFSDGTAAESFYIRGFRVPNDGVDRAHNVSRSVGPEKQFEISSVLHINADKSINVYDFEMMLPIAYYETKDLDKTVVDQWLEAGKKQITDMLKLDSHAFDDSTDYNNEESSDNMLKEYEHNLYTGNHSFKVFGSDYATELHCYSEAEMSLAGTDKQATTYHAYIKVCET